MPDFLTIRYGTGAPVVTLCHQRVNGDTRVDCPCADPRVNDQVLHGSPVARIVEERDTGRAGVVTVPVDILHDADTGEWLAAERRP